MKLKSAVFHEALKAAYKQLGISASYDAASSFTQLGTAATFSASAIKASFQTGEFLISSEFLDVLNPLDGVGSSDGALLSFFKGLTDDTNAAENATLAFYKVLGENGYVTDQQLFNFFKAITNTTTLTDAPIKSFSTVYSNGAAITDPISKQFGASVTNVSIITDVPLTTAGKVLFEAPAFSDEVNTFGVVKILSNQTTVTDDLDGEATPLDDQEMQFAKVTGNISTATDTFTRNIIFTRTFLNNSDVTDNDVLNVGKKHSDTTSMTDVGSLRSQGFADFTYFAEDYVGASRTFT